MTLTGRASTTLRARHRIQIEISKNSFRYHEKHFRDTQFRIFSSLFTDFNKNISNFLFSCIFQNTFSSDFYNNTINGHS